MKAIYTKKAESTIFDFVANDQDFADLFTKFYNRIKPEYNGLYETQRIEKRDLFREIVRRCVVDYLYNFDYLDKKYLDITWLEIKQYGKSRIVDLDTIYDIFRTELEQIEKENNK